MPNHANGKTRTRPRSRRVSVIRAGTWSASTSSPRAG